MKSLRIADGLTDRIRIIFVRGQGVSKSRLGFTIVETMIVLAITGLLFVLIAGSLAGRQNKNEFIQAIHDLRGQIQGQIGAVQTGYYPDLGNFQCQDSGSGIAITAGSNESGTNGDCVFLGEVLQFGVNDGSDNEKVLVFPVAGKREASDLDSASPTLIASSSSWDNTTSFGASYGLKAVKMTANGSAIGQVAILSSLGDLGDSASGAQQIDIYALNGSSLGRAKSSAIVDATKALNNEGSYSRLKNPDGGVNICFVSGTTNQYGLITIGQNHLQLDVNLRIMEKNSTNQDCGL